MYYFMEIIRVFFSHNYHGLIIFNVLLFATCQSLIFIDEAYFAIFPIFLYFALKIKKYLLFKSSVQLILYSVLGFTFWCAITGFWSPTPSETYSRAFWYLLVAVASIIIGYRSTSGTLIIKPILLINIIIIVTTIFSLATSIPIDAWTGGNQFGFKAFFVHQNSLGAFIAFTLPFYVYSGFTNISSIFHSKPKCLLIIRQNFWQIILFLINFSMLFLSRSRGSLLSVFIFILIFSFYALKLRSLIILSLTIVAILGGLYSINDYFKGSVNGIIYKNEISIGANRYNLIKQSIASAKENYWFGIGYGASHFGYSSLSDRPAKNYNPTERREKMISTLALVEEVGIIGLFIFLIPIVYLINFLLKETTKRKQSKKSGCLRFIRYDFIHDRRFIDIAFLSGYILSLIVHAQIESWWVGVASTQLPFFYITIGFCARIKDNLYL